jgi:hypothetical protein
LAVLFLEQMHCQNEKDTRNLQGFWDNLTPQPSWLQNALSKNNPQSSFPPPTSSIHYILITLMFFVCFNLLAVLICFLMAV